MSHNVVFWNDVYSSSQAERWPVWGKNAFCLTSHWCYQTPPPTARGDLGMSADFDVWRIVFLFPFLLFLPLGWIIAGRIFFRWVSPPSLNYSGQTDLKRSSSLRTQESVRVWWCLMQRCCFGFALTQTPFFLHTFLVLGWVGGLMQEVIRLKNVLKLLKNMYTLQQPHGTTRSTCPQINLSFSLSFSE